MPITSLWLRRNGAALWRWRSDRAGSQPRFWHCACWIQRRGMERTVPRVELCTLGVVDRSVHGDRDGAGSGTSNTVARHLAGMAIRRPGPRRGASALRNRDYVIVVVHGVCLRIAAGGDPGGERPADTADYRHHTAPRQRGALQRRLIRLCARVLGDDA